MPTQRSLFELVRHMEWADAVAWTSVLTSETARSTMRVQRLLCHIHNVQRGFLSIWRGESPEFQTPERFEALPDMMLWGRDGHGRFQSFLTGARLEQFEDPVRLPWAAEILGVGEDQVQHPTLEQSVFQVITHSSHHRGQVNALLRSIGVEPQLTDFVAWLWRGQPLPPWPMP